MAKKDVVRHAHVTEGKKLLEQWGIRLARLQDQSVTVAMVREQIGKNPAADVALAALLGNYPTPEVAQLLVEWEEKASDKELARYGKKLAQKPEAEESDLVGKELELAGGDRRLVDKGVPAVLADRLAHEALDRGRIPRREELREASGRHRLERRAVSTWREALVRSFTPPMLSCGHSCTPASRAASATDGRSSAAPRRVARRSVESRSPSPSSCSSWS